MDTKNKTTNVATDNEEVLEAKGTEDTLENSGYYQYWKLFHGIGIGI